MKKSCIDWMALTVILEIEMMSSPTLRNKGIGRLRYFEERTLCELSMYFSWDIDVDLLVLYFKACRILLW